MREVNKYDKDRSAKAVAFLDAIAEVSRMHNLVLGHEDGHGGFLVEEFNEPHIDWLMAAAEVVEEAE